PTTSTLLPYTTLFRSEHERGAGVGYRNLVYLHGDVGVGGGIIVDGRLLDGERGYGCELGHMVEPVPGAAVRLRLPRLPGGGGRRDRKSTRLNSSHVKI